MSAVALPAAAETFLASRRRGIGGSDCHHLLSEPPYGCRRWLAYDKSGTASDYGRDQGTERILRRGTRLEEVVAEEYSAATGQRVRHMPVRVDRDRPWRLVHIDRQILGDARGPGALECKTANEWVFRSFKREGLPAAYLLQLQWALAVTGYAWGAFAVLEPASFELLTFEQARNERLIAGLELAADTFWHDHLAGKLPPPLTDAGDPRCESCEFRRTCRGTPALVQTQRPEPVPEPAIDDGLAEVVRDYLEAQQSAKDSAVLRDRIGDALKLALGAREHVLVPAARARVSYAQADDSLMWDTRYLDAHLDQIPAELAAAAHKTRKGARPLIVRACKEES